MRPKPAGDLKVTKVEGHVGRAAVPSRDLAGQRSGVSQVVGPGKPRHRIPILYSTHEQ